MAKGNNRQQKDKKKPKKAAKQFQKDDRESGLSFCMICGMVISETTFTIKEKKKGGPHGKSSTAYGNYI